jgi:hypothetical protein
MCGHGKRRGSPGQATRLSGTFLSPARNIPLYKVHSIDSTRFPTFGDVTGTQEINAMQQHNSIFHSIVPWDAFEQAIEQHAAKDCARDFSHRSHLVAILYAQFVGAVSVRRLRFFGQWDKLRADRSKEA